MADVEPQLPDGTVLVRAAELLKALGHPLRLALVAQLAAAPRCVHELMATTGASQSLVSQHLRVLRAADVVQGTRLGKEVEYSLVDEHVVHVAQDAIRHCEEPGGQERSPLPSHGEGELAHDPNRARRTA